MARPPISVAAGPADLHHTTTTSLPPPDTGVSKCRALPRQRRSTSSTSQSIDLYEPVVAGEQDEIDQGHVTAVDWSAGGYPTSCRPGDGCTVWLAGHRSTHQAVFARLPEITTGSPIEIHVDGRAHAYVVTDVVTVPGSSPPSVIHGDLVLQTSAPGGQRILVYAATISSS